MKLPRVNDTPKIHLRSLGSVNCIDTWLDHEIFVKLTEKCTNVTLTKKTVQKRHFDGKKQGLHWKFHKNSLFSKLYRNTFCHFELRRY